MASKSKKVKVSESELQEKLVALNRVAKVVKGGRRFSFTAIVVVGDGNGAVGHGLGKAAEATNAIAKGFEDAKKNLIRVPIINGTVPHDIEVKFGASKIIIKPAAPGTGVLAGGAMRAVLESAGVKDVLGKSHGSSNPHNVVKATMKALTLMRDAYTVARTRGLTLKQLFGHES
ncbi:MAG: 30S ribosomal protein S5 [Bacteroidia bacterium]|nr:30S ribosomal protein S5 [Bacteroidia bacterium]